MRTGAVLTVVVGVVLTAAGCGPAPDDEALRAAETPGSAVQQPAPSDVETAPAREARLATFRSVHWAAGGGLCPAQHDCAGFDAVSDDGLLRVDPLGRAGAPVVEARLDAGELARVRDLATRPELAAFLRAAAERCPAVSDAYQVLELSLAPGPVHGEVTGCAGAEALRPLRDTLQALRQKYAP